MNADAVVDLFRQYRRSDDDAIAVAVIQTLTDIVAWSNATTIMGLEQELNQACDILTQASPSSQNISLTAGCDLFRRYVTRTSLELIDFSKCKERIKDRGKKFALSSLQSRERIASFGVRFIQEGSVILVHGHSPVVTGLLQSAARQGKQFRVMLTEGRCQGSAEKMAPALIEAGIPVALVMDAAVAFIMEKVDVVLLGASAVVESGGIINSIGTYQVAIVAQAFNRPVYAAAESYTFTRLFPLSQRGFPSGTCKVSRKARVIGADGELKPLPESVALENPSLDYTPPEYITLLLTDLGILTPSAVSDELIKLYY